ANTAYGQDHRAFRVLRLMKIEFRPGLKVQPLMLDVSDDTNDRDPQRIFLRVSFSDAFANGVLSRPVPLGERLVDDNYRRRFFVVCRREITSVEKGNLHGLEIVSSDYS